MNELMHAIQELDRSTRDLHTRWFPDNPPSLDVRLAVWGEEIYEWTAEYVLYTNREDCHTDNQDALCEECADLVVTTLGLLHWKEVNAGELFHDIELLIEGQLEDIVSIRDVYRMMPGFLAGLTPEGIQDVMAYGAEFIVTVCSKTLSASVPIESIITAMHAVAAKNDAKTPANGYHINAAGKIARVSK